MRSGTIDVLAFRQRPGEQLVVGDVFGSQIGADAIIDVAIELDRETASYYAVSVALRATAPCHGAGPADRFGARSPPSSARTPTSPRWSEPARCTPPTWPSASPALPPQRRCKLADLMEDDRLADLLEELPEEDQLRIMDGPDLERAARPRGDGARRRRRPARRDGRGRPPAAPRGHGARGVPAASQLLTYDDDTAGGLMTPEPVILPFTATVAEALAVIREADLPVELVKQVFVVQPPTSTPTGRYLGLVPFQRLLVEAPSTTLEHCLFAEPDPVAPELPLRDVAERLAAYDALAVPVCDVTQRLVGAVTVDDVLDHVLPDDWRRPPAVTGPAMGPGWERPDGPASGGPERLRQGFRIGAPTSTRSVGSPRRSPASSAPAGSWWARRCSSPCGSRSTWWPSSSAGTRTRSSS